MPNYCDNSLTITGSRNTLSKIRILLHTVNEDEDNVFDFEKIIPMPDYIYKGNLGPEEEKIYGKNNWYDWSYENWGTKWNSVDASVFQDDECLEYSFETAWSPCEPVIEKLATMFPDVKIFYSYSECGMCFCGKKEYENGQMTYYMEGDYVEYWFDDGYNEDDEDDREILKERDNPGIFYSIKNKEELGAVTKCDFTYLDNDDERSIQIEGSFWDARSEKSEFYW